MAEMRIGTSERAIRWTTILSVIILAVIAAIVSYKHMYVLVRRYGEASWTAALLPVSVDGMIVASSMSLLLDSRCGRRSGFLPWELLIIGSTASLAANVAVAEPSAIGRLIAGWPSCALIGSYELLMRQIRRTSVQSKMLEGASACPPPEVATAAELEAEEPHMWSAATTGPAYESPTSPTISYQLHTDGRADFVGTSGGHRRDPTDTVRSAYLPARGASDGRDAGIQQQAWHWANANRTPHGDLPSGKAIARRFGRSERWGRLVKQAGITGRLPEAAGLRAQASVTAPTRG